MKITKREFAFDWVYLWLDTGESFKLSLDSATYIPMIGDELQLTTLVGDFEESYQLYVTPFLVQYEREDDENELKEIK